MVQAHSHHASFTDHHSYKFRNKIISSLNLQKNPRIYIFIQFTVLAVFLGHVSFCGLTCFYKITNYNRVLLHKCLITDVVYAAVTVPSIF